MTPAKMFVLRLFYKDRPFEQVEARLLAPGQITLGRDSDVDWPLPDTEGTISRVHCMISVREDRIYLVDQSSNGTFLENGERVETNESIELHAQQSIHLGAFSLLIELQQTDDARCDQTTIAGSATLPSTATEEWVADDAALVSTNDTSLLEAFCEGAKLDASALSSEDPADVMRRVGAIYQQAVVGLSKLMLERARIKSELSLEQTKIGAIDNNPFKWSPTRKLAQDLLCTQDAGFLSDAEAVKASFEDIINHVTAVSLSATMAIDDMLRSISPVQIEAEAKLQGNVLKSKSQVCWDLYTRRHIGLSRNRNGPGEIDQTIADAYGRVSKVQA